MIKLCKGSIKGGIDKVAIDGRSWPIHLTWQSSCQYGAYHQQPGSVHKADQNLIFLPWVYELYYLLKSWCKYKYSSRQPFWWLKSCVAASHVFYKPIRASLSPMGQRMGGDYLWIIMGQPKPATIQSSSGGLFQDTQAILQTQDRGRWEKNARQDLCLGIGIRIALTWDSFRQAFRYVSLCRARRNTFEMDNVTSLLIVQWAEAPSSEGLLEPRPPPGTIFPRLKLGQGEA